MAMRRIITPSQAKEPGSFDPFMILIQAPDQAFPGVPLAGHKSNVPLAAFIMASEKILNRSGSQKFQLQPT